MTKTINSQEKPVAVLEQGTYEVIRNRLVHHAGELRARLQQLNAARQQVFGAIRTALIATDRITTHNKCLPRDMVSIGPARFLFGYNVHVGLRSETHIADVFAVYEHRQHQFREVHRDALASPEFEADFKTLYTYYRHTTFARFQVDGPHLYMVFQVSRGASDVKTFKWLLQDDRLVYLGNRSDHELRPPVQHEFQWTRTHRDLHRFGAHPHISIEDKIFVETIGGDLTLKVEDNTSTGAGIYSEPVIHSDQTLDDAEIYYALLGNLILLKIKPYQEKKFRHLVYNEKLQQVTRIDTLEDACVLLPDNQGILFGNGYYLQTGQFKTFAEPFSGLKFDGRSQAPNGEDYLYRFYHPDSGNYVLMPYNLIEQSVDMPIVCGGCSLFDNGELALFKDGAEPQKHHLIQVWQTPFASSAQPPVANQQSLLYKIGNADLVTAMAECQELLRLLDQQDTYAHLYHDILKKSAGILDSYFWLGEEASCNLKQPLAEIRAAAAIALDEFEKVLRVRRSTADEAGRVTARAAALVQSIPYGRLNELNLFVSHLTALRAVRGELCAAKELRYVDLSCLEQSEKEVLLHLEKLSGLTVEFLAAERALSPYRTRIEEAQTLVGQFNRVTDARQCDQNLGAVATELEMLVEVVGHLKIDDATLATRILESLATVYAALNQARAACQQKRLALQASEAGAEFASQMQLLNQAVVHYLDRSDTTVKCDQYLTKLVVQIEELEARFADFEDFVGTLHEKRAELINTFESRKIALLEALNKRTNGVFAAAERILQGIQHRVEQLKTAEEIHGFCASDLMIQKARQLVAQLVELGDSVKADHLQARLKTLQENALRQLKDRQELGVAGQDLIRLGPHAFSINTQPLELTVVDRGGGKCFHLTGTRFFEEIDDPDFLATRPVWGQEFAAENAEVYRGEFLAYKTFEQLRERGQLEAAAKCDPAQTASLVAQVMAQRYAEGYFRGVHDADAGQILRGLLEIHAGSDLLRYSSEARACANAFWHQFPAGPSKDLLAAKLRGYGLMGQVFRGGSPAAGPGEELEQDLRRWLEATGLFGAELALESGEYLSLELRRGSSFVVSPEAVELRDSFWRYLQQRDFEQAFVEARASIEADFAGTWQLVREWLANYARQERLETEYLEEAVLLLLSGPDRETSVVKASVVRQLGPLRGRHGLIREGTYSLHYSRFMRKLRDFASKTVPQFEHYQRLKKALLERQAAALALDQFKPRVLTSFVRNRLIDSVYLSLIGENLAKQIGVAGESKRTDLMGMLLLISPPGYGKTTLMEYIAHRLGLVFVKVNGPALGEKVFSLDPAEAPNAGARQELEKLNLALEMGDNLMLYLDDIQHCHPEFLQKFISLCDGQRKIEGVYRGKARTYDLRGCKIAVVMAGNPYTENGDKFQVPDMLANRADTYNLGDIIGSSEDAFKLSYLENAMTSNPVLARLALRQPQDIYPLARLAETGTREGVEFAGTYSAEELNELVDVTRKLLRIREVILKVNAEYIRSAAQAEAYRTEPHFKLQGSYRNMNRLAEQVLPVMTVTEVEDLVQQHYRNESQTLTKGAEANLLKFKELTGTLSANDAERWTYIKRTFKKNLLLQTHDGRDPVALVVHQLSAFNDGLQAIKEVLAGNGDAAKSATMILMPTPSMQALPEASARPQSPAEESVREVRISPETLKKIWELVDQQNGPG